MKRQNCGPRLGKLVYQLPGVINLAYDLCLAIIIPRFQDLEEAEKNQLTYLGLFRSLRFLLKHLLVPQNSYGSLRPEKLPKIVSFATTKKTDEKQWWESKWNR